MGTNFGTTCVDPVSLLTAAGHLDVAADVMASVLGGPLRGLRFSAGAAGRVHTESGGEIRAALDRLVADAAGWAHAARELARTLEACAHQHSRRETDAAAALR